jgi:hypothetical protein
MNSTESITLSPIDLERMRSASFFDAEARRRWVGWLAEKVLAVEVSKKNCKRTKDGPGQNSKARGTRDIVTRDVDHE